MKTFSPVEPPAKIPSSGARVERVDGCNLYEKVVMKNKKIKHFVYSI
jgi:hypothetical protein